MEHLLSGRHHCNLLSGKGFLHVTARTHSLIKKGLRQIGSGLFEPAEGQNAFPDKEGIKTQPSLPYR